MFKETEGNFSSFDGTRLFYRLYSAKDPDGLMVILHGHGEHSGRYVKFPQFLEGLNLTLAIYDARGHGRSEGREVDVESFEDYLHDLSCFLDFLKTRAASEGMKTILFGHSMGGLVAVHWALRNPQQVSGLVLSSPCLGLRLPPFVVGFNSFVHGWAPRFLYRNPIYPPHLTHSPEEVERYRRDPLIKRKISVRLLHEMITYIARLRAVTSIHFPFPFYVLMAGVEKVVDPEETKAFFARAQAPRKDLKVFSRFYHEIFNELSQEEAFDSLRNCLREIKKGSGS